MGARTHPATSGLPPDVPFEALPLHDMTPPPGSSDGTPGIDEASCFRISGCSGYALSKTSLRRNCQHGGVEPLGGEGSYPQAGSAPPVGHVSLRDLAGSTPNWHARGRRDPRPWFRSARSTADLSPTPTSTPVGGFREPRVPSSSTSLTVPAPSATPGTGRCNPVEPLLMSLSISVTPMLAPTDLAWVVFSAATRTPHGPGRVHVLVVCPVPSCPRRLLPLPCRLQWTVARPIALPRATTCDDRFGSRRSASNIQTG